LEMQQPIQHSHTLLGPTRKFQRTQPHIVSFASPSFCSRYFFSPSTIKITPYGYEWSRRKLPSKLPPSLAKLIISF
jgi:hypothetical protein